MKGFYPNAVVREIKPGPSDPAIVPTVAILHVDAGNADSLYNLFKNNQSNGSGVEAHFHIKLNGVVEQYRSIYFQCDANYKANPFAVAIETQGFGGGYWTREQLASIKDLLHWLHDEARIPLVKCDNWQGPGVGYHIQFGAPGWWTPVAKSCPGPNRIEQFNKNIVPWMKSPRAKLVPVSWNNFVHILPYYKNNSFFGIDKAASTTKRIDLDFNISLDGVWCCTHWLELNKEGFRYTQESFEKGFCSREQVGKLTGKRVDQTPWRVIKTLRTPDGFRIYSAASMIYAAAKAKVKVEIEPKFLVTTEQWENMKANCIKSYGINWKSYVYAKQLPQFAWRRTLSRARAVGFTTIRLQVKYPSLLPKYIQYYRR